MNKFSNTTRLGNLIAIGFVALFFLGNLGKVKAENNVKFSSFYNRSLYFAVINEGEEFLEALKAGDRKNLLNHELKHRFLFGNDVVLFFLKNWRDAENYESLNGKIADYISKLEPNTASATLRGKKDDGSPALLVFIKLGKEKWNQECLADYFISEIVGGSAILKTCKI